MKNPLRAACAAQVDHVQQAGPSNGRSGNLVIYVVVETAFCDLLLHGCSMKAECGELGRPIL